MNKIEVISKVENGKLTRNRTEVERAIKSFEGKHIVITIERKRKKRSNQQSRWYYGVAVELVRMRLRELGTILSKDDTHTLIKLAIGKIDYDLIYQDIPSVHGEALNRMRSTTEFTTSEFMDFKAHIQQWAAETLDLQIPDPNEQLNLIEP